MDNVDEVDSLENQGVFANISLYIFGKVWRQLAPMRSWVQMVLDVIPVVEGPLVAGVVDDVVGDVIFRARIAWIDEDVLRPVA